MEESYAKQGKLRKNPHFGQQNQNQYQGNSSDDETPIGFSRRRNPGSSNSSSKQRLESQGLSHNMVNIGREENRNSSSDQRSQNRVYYPQPQLDSRQDSSRQRYQQQQEEDMIHQQTEMMLEQKRQEIEQRLMDHDRSIQNDKKMQGSNEKPQQRNDLLGQSMQNSRGPMSTTQGQYMGQHQAYPQQNYDQFRIQIPNQQTGLLQTPGQQYQHSVMSHSQPSPLQYSNVSQLGQSAQNPHNYFPPQLMPNLPQYTNLDIPGHLDQNIKKMQDTLNKLRQENSSLKGELNKKQVLNQDTESVNFTEFDKEKYQLHAQTNLKLKQQVEDMKRKEIELKSRLSSLQANQQYLQGRTTTLGMDIDQQDRQEDALNRQIQDFNGLIREKEIYIKQLMIELSNLKEGKEQFQSELNVLNHKEEFMVNELIFKEDQLNEIMMNNDDMRRKIQAGQSQSKYLIAENERLKKELSQLKEESAVLKASSDFIQNELMGLSEHLNEYEHKLVMSQNTIDQLQRQNQQAKSELAHYNATIQSQQKTYDELKNQLQIINERNQRISMQNEMMMLKQTQQQEQLLFQMSSARKNQANDGYGMDKSDNEEEFEREQMQEEVPENRIRDSIPQVSMRMKPSSRVEGSPYEEIRRRNKEGDAMHGSLQWKSNDKGGDFQNKRDSYQASGRFERSQNKGEKLQTVADVIAWAGDDQDQRTSISQQFKKPQNNQIQPKGGDTDFDRDDWLENRSRERSKSGRRQDQMNQVLKWGDQDDYNKPRNQNLFPSQGMNPHERSMSRGRKERQGQSETMQNLLKWEGEGAEQSPFREREMMKRSEENMKWNASPDIARRERMQNAERNRSPIEDGQNIRSKHHGQDMAGLLSFQQEGDGNSSLQNSSQKWNREKKPSKYGQISINIAPQGNVQMQQYNRGLDASNSFRQNTQNQSLFNSRQDSYVSQKDSRSYNAHKVNTRKVDIDLNSLRDGSNSNSAVQTPQNRKTNAKNYGQMSEQVYKQQLSRKEYLDKCLLQMQIEKEKLITEQEKIGEHPKTTNQHRRKNEIRDELQTLNNNISTLMSINCQDKVYLSDDKRGAELLFVFEVTRHGARTGLHNDYYQTPWIEGELTQLGARQHYLIGREIRNKYIDDLNFLSPEYDPREIYVRSTCFNRTIESAYSQLLGIYPPSSNTHQLFPNQSESQLPPLNISQDLINQVNNNLGMNALPFNFQPIPVHSYFCDHDYFTSYGLCPAFVDTRAIREKNKTHEQFMNENYKLTLDKLAQALKMDKSNFPAHKAVRYIDSIWARYYEGLEISPDFTPEFLNDIMDLFLEYFNFTAYMNETIRRAYLTGQIGEFVEIMTGVVEKDREGELNQNERTKFYFYSDHDDSIIALSNAFEHQLGMYPPFASVVIYEVWRMEDDKYYINITINDHKVLLKRECGGKYLCNIEDFKEMAKRISYYGDQSGFTELCGKNNEVFSFTYEEFEKRNAIYHQEPDRDSLYFQRRGKYFPDYSRFIIAYCVNMILGILIWKCCKKVYKKNEIRN